MTGHPSVAPCGVCGGDRIGRRIGWPGLRDDCPPPLRGKSLPVCGARDCDAHAIARMIRAAGPGWPFPFHMLGPDGIRPSDLPGGTNDPAPRPVTAAPAMQQSLL